MGKIRLLQFPVSSSNGGMTRYEINNCIHLDKSKLLCDFGTVSKYLGFHNELIKLGSDVKYISCNAEENPHQFVEELRKILLNNYDIVHLHTGYWKSFLVEEIACECEIPKIIVHSHSTKVDISDHFKRKEAEKLHETRKQQFNSLLATDFWACSVAAADWLFGEQIPRERIIIMKNAIEVEKFLFNQDVRERYRRELGLEGCFVVGNIGRLCYSKNQEFLLRVFAEVYQHRKNARLLLIGGGELEKALMHQAEELQIASSVLFMGPRSDVQNLLQAMDVFCLPSKFEGLPISLIEAQSAGLKCVSSDSVTKEAGITDNLQFLPLEEDSWVQYLLDIARDYERKDMYEVITAAGYNIKNQIREVERLYLA